eukprot:513371_1
MEQLTQSKEYGSILMEEDKKDNWFDETYPGIDIDTDRRKFKENIYFVDKIVNLLDDKENIDFYQLAAFRPYSTKSTKKYRTIILAIICIITQITGMTIILMEVIGDGIQNKTFCNKNPIQYKILAFGLSALIGYISMDAVLKVEKGMYSSMSRKEYLEKPLTRMCSGWKFQELEWISNFWLEIGKWTNRIVTISSVVGSFMVIFFSETGFDMVLNSVALFFLIELDDMLLTQKSYNEMKQWFSKWDLEMVRSIAQSQKIDRQAMERFKPFINQGHNEFNNLSVIFRIAYCFDGYCTCCYILFRYIVLAVCVVVPFYIGVCY